MGFPDGSGACVTLTDEQYMGVRSPRGVERVVARAVPPFTGAAESNSGSTVATERREESGTIEHGKSCLGERAVVFSKTRPLPHTLTELTLSQRTAESRNRKIRRPRVASSKHAEYRTRHTARHAPSLASISIGSLQRAAQNACAAAARLIPRLSLTSSRPPSPFRAFVCPTTGRARSKRPICKRASNRSNIDSRSAAGCSAGTRAAARSRGARDASRRRRSGRIRAAARARRCWPLDARSTLGKRARHSRGNGASTATSEIAARKSCKQRKGHREATAAACSPNRWTPTMSTTAHASRTSHPDLFETEMAVSNRAASSSAAQRSADLKAQTFLETRASTLMTMRETCMRAPSALHRRHVALAPVPPFIITSARRSRRRAN